VRPRALEITNTERDNELKTLSDETINQEEGLDYRNAGQPVEDRVADLLGRMTVEERWHRCFASGSEEGDVPR